MFSLQIKCLEDEKHGGNMGKNLLAKLYTKKNTW